MKVGACRGVPASGCSHSEATESGADGPRRLSTSIICFHLLPGNLSEVTGQDTEKRRSARAVNSGHNKIGTIPAAAMNRAVGSRQIQGGASLEGLCPLVSGNSSSPQTLPRTFPWLLPRW